MKYLFQILILMCFATINAQTSVHLADSLYLLGNYSKAIEAYKSVENQDEVYNKLAQGIHRFR